MLRSLMLGKNFSRQHFDFFFLFFSDFFIFLFFSEKPPEETTCMKCQRLFSGKNKKNIINLASAEFAHRVLKVNFQWKTF